MAILEPTGQLSIYLNKSIKKEVLPVILSGSYQEYNIDLLNLKKETIKEYLEQNKLMESDVFYLSSDGTKFFLLQSL